MATHYDAKEVKHYYYRIEDYDWVEAADSLKGPETIFHRNRERVMKELIIRHLQKGNHLDLGCGTGLILRHIPEVAVGLDINPRNLRRCKTHAPSGQLVLGDAESLPFADCSFSMVICTEVLEHLLDPSQCVGEIKRVLKAGGILIGDVPCRSLIWRLRFLSSTCPRAEPFHNEYSRKELSQLLAQWFERVDTHYSLLRMTLVFIAHK